MTHAEALILEDRVRRDMRTQHRAVFHPFAPEGYTEFHTAYSFYGSAQRLGVMTEAEHAALEAYYGERWHESNCE